MMACILNCQPWPASNWLCPAMPSIAGRRAWFLMNHCLSISSHQPVNCATPVYLKRISIEFFNRLNFCPFFFFFAVLYFSFIFQRINFNLLFQEVWVTLTHLCLLFISSTLFHSKREEVKRVKSSKKTGLRLGQRPLLQKHKAGRYQKKTNAMFKCLWYHCRANRTPILPSVAFYFIQWHNITDWEKVLVTCLVFSFFVPFSKQLHLRAKIMYWLWVLRN